MPAADPRRFRNRDLTWTPAHRRLAVLPDRLRAPGGHSCKRSLCPTRLAARRMPAHGGLRCQEGVLACPGDLEIAGLAGLFCWLSAQLPCSCRRAVGVKPERP